MVTTDHVTKRISSNEQSMLLAKLRNFFRKSISMYFFASLLIAIGKPDLFGGLFWTGLVVFVIICILSFILMYLSSKSQARNVKFDANVTFAEPEITLEHVNKNLTERNKWDWIESWQENKHGFFMTIKNNPKMKLILLNGKLSAEEASVMRSLLEKNVKKS